MTVFKVPAKEWGLLCSYTRQNRVPHAFLVSGKPGIGKGALAHQFAYSLLCLKPQNDGFMCGVCPSCLLIQSGTHPDLFCLEPDEDKTTISINQIRKLINDTYLKPQFEKYRVAIMSPANAMSPSAINAFLKCLEEPTERTIFILITEKPRLLPATIVSRCQQIKCTFPDKAVLMDWLQGQGITSHQDTLLTLAQNAIISVEDLTNQTIMNQRMACFQDWMAVASYQSYPGLVSEKWQKLPKTALLNWLISWVVDITKCRFGVHADQLLNPDLAKPTQEIAQRLNLPGVFNLYDLLLSCRKRLDTQINYQMMIEDILVHWQALNGRTQRCQNH